MSYERKDIPALISVFRAAKKVLKSGGTMHYLCHALAELSGKHSSKNLRMAKQLVESAIDHHVALEGYYNYDSRCTGTLAGRRQLRILWCDKIIADLQEYAK